MMNKYQRQSPLDFGMPNAQIQPRNGWQVALAYEGEGSGPFVIDLSHRPKWDLQDANLGRFQPWGLTIPEQPGQCVLERGILINRMNRTQCAIWHLGPEQAAPPQEKSYTETTDGQALLAVVGTRALAVMEHITSLDLTASRLNPPCLIQGPILHIPCQVVLLSRSAEAAQVVFSFSRGYGQAMAEAIMQCGSDLGLEPGGENRLKL
jgi:hypothetical protein